MKLIGMVLAGYFAIQGAYELIPMETPIAFLDTLPDWGTAIPTAASSQSNWTAGLLDLATAFAAWHFIVK
jgi:hypothetical protein